MWHARSSLRHTGPFSRGMWDLVPRPGMEPGHPALGAWSLTHWATREVPVFVLNSHIDKLSVSTYLLFSPSKLEAFSSQVIDYSYFFCIFCNEM